MVFFEGKLFGHWTAIAIDVVFVLFINVLDHKHWVLVYQQRLSREIHLLSSSNDQRSCNSEK